MSPSAVAWAILFVAALLEIVWALALKQAEGFSRLWPSVVGITVAVASFALLTIALRQLPVGTAYAVWVGIGAVGVAVTGMLFLGEAVTAPRLAFLGLIVVGVVGLRAVES
ncbi:quaternary ammonium compound-resistance protein SugE [Actinoalloteichus hoggarensis]|uniref:Quaternary ammonium compound-resistance protein SugE n=1 Tax=Actinoalloteichus hoggarensis TaxID=1470176 RepID=A0A221W624_9PSEU|nr:multidrug efflux SMR transporter [Actinoalloteichus hoggarensis]ASO21133.1 Quaternary ammonium compound-resistance protein SugE [Actinoalloteichus hoggarensis]MBB5921062.1 quaternary ammonium compound-resistance protein SugE [Actinoalloteichus hoggarensis]